MIACAPWSSVASSRKSSRSRGFSRTWGFVSQWDVSVTYHPGVGSSWWGRKGRIFAIESLGVGDASLITSSRCPSFLPLVFWTSLPRRSTIVNAPCDCDLGAPRWRFIGNDASIDVQCRDTFIVSSWGCASQTGMWKVRVSINLSTTLPLSRFRDALITLSP